jgi:hypothetical protein
MDLKGMVSNIPGLGSKIEEFMEGLNFPASKQDITSKAREKGADDNIMSMLQKLPDKMYQSQNDIKNELGNLMK